MRQPLTSHSHGHYLSSQLFQNLNFMHPNHWHDLLSFEFIPWYSESIRTIILWTYHLYSLAQYTLIPLYPDSVLWSDIIPLTYTSNFLPPCSLCPAYMVRLYPKLNQTLWLVPICTKQLSMTENKCTTMPLFLCHFKFNAKNSGVHVMLLAITPYFPSPSTLLLP